MARSICVADNEKFYYFFLCVCAPQVLSRAPGSSGQLGIRVADHGGAGCSFVTLPSDC